MTAVDTTPEIAAADQRVIDAAAWKQPRERRWKLLFRDYLARSAGTRRQLQHVMRDVHPIHSATRLAVVDVPLDIRATAETLAARSYLPLDALLQQPVPAASGGSSADLPPEARAEVETVQRALADPAARLYLVSGAVTQLASDPVPSRPGTLLALGSALPYLARAARDVPEGAAPLREAGHALRARTDLDVPLCAPLAVQEAGATLDPAAGAVRPFTRMGEQNFSALLALGGTDRRALAHGAVLLPADPTIVDAPPASLADAAWVLVPPNHILRMMCEFGVRNPETRDLVPGSQAPAVMLPLDTGAPDDTASSIVPLAVLPAATVRVVLGYADSFLAALLPDPLPRDVGGVTLELVDGATLAPLPWAALPPATPVAVRATLRLAVAIVPSAAHEHLYPSMPLRDTAVAMNPASSRRGEKEE